MLDCCGWVAQLVEQRIENPRVGGSIPPPATNKSKGSSCPVNIDVVFLQLAISMSHFDAVFDLAGVVIGIALHLFAPPAGIVTILKHIDSV